MEVVIVTGNSVVELTPLQFNHSRACFHLLRMTVARILRSLTASCSSSPKLDTKPSSHEPLEPSWLKAQQLRNTHRR